MLRFDELKQYAKPMPFLGILPLVARIHLDEYTPQMVQVMRHMTGKTDLEVSDEDDLFDPWQPNRLAKACADSLEFQLGSELEDIRRPTRWSNDTVEKWVAYENSQHDEIYPVVPILHEDAGFLSVEDEIIYRVLCIGQYAKSPRNRPGWTVVCKSQYGSTTDVWSLKDFLGDTDVNGPPVRRFQYIGNKA